MLRTFLFICGIILAPALQAEATDPGSAIGAVMQMLLGNKYAQDKVKHCALADNDPKAQVGVVTMVNNFLCGLEKLGAKGPGKYTFQNGSSSLKAEVESARGGYNYNGVQYDHRAKVWTCPANCGVASKFSRVIFLAWSSQDRDVNKGFLLFNPEPTTTGAGLRATYDLGRHSSQRTIGVMAVCGGNSTCLPWTYPDGTTSLGGELSAQLTLQGSQLELTALFVTGPAAPSPSNVFRMAGSIDYTHDGTLGSANFGVGSTVPGIIVSINPTPGIDFLTNSDLGAANVPINNSVCISRDGDQVNVVADASGCPALPSYPQSFINVGAYTPDSVLSSEAPALGWAGMAETPSF